MPPRRKSKGTAAAVEAEAAGAAVAEMDKHTDATDEEQSSDDEAPEEVSTAAATALAGRRRKAELEARKTVPKRKRARASSKANKAAQGDDGKVNSELELPSELLLKVKSGGLQRMEAEARELDEANVLAEAETAAELGLARRAERATKIEDIPRSDNFRLVVLDKDEDGMDGGAGSKSHAAETANGFLRKRMQGQKRVSHGLFKARRRLGPSPNF